MQFVQARHYRRGRLAPIRVVVIHDVEAAETARTAENVAGYFAGPGSPLASTHYTVDSDSEVQSVREADTAYAAPGCNSDGIQIEHAGYAGQGVAGWADPYSQAMLSRSAVLVRGICDRYGIPKRRLTVAELRAGHKGIVGHADVNAAYHQSDHTDPGPTFPWDQYLRLVTGGGTAPAQNGTSPLTVYPLGGISARGLRVGATSEDVRRFQKALWRAHGPAYRASIRKSYDFEARGFTQFYGPLTARMCEDAYRAWGWLDGDLRTPGPRMLRRLGFSA